MRGYRLSVAGVAYKGNDIARIVSVVAVPCLGTSRGVGGWRVDRGSVSIPGSDTVD